LVTYCNHNWNQGQLRSEGFKDSRIQGVEWRKTEVRSQKTEVRRQKVGGLAEGRGQRADVRGKKAEVRGLEGWKFSKKSERQMRN